MKETPRSLAVAILNRVDQAGLFAEPLLDRCLERWEHVHHVDGDRANKSPRNLRVMDIREHTAHAFTWATLLAYCA